MVLGLRRKPKDKAEDNHDRKRKAPVRTGPQLLVLVPTIAGVSSYRLHCFDDSAGAAKFISTSPHPATRTSAYAFWALPLKPRSSQPDSGDEAIVLIRTDMGSDSVSLVSFVDIESAQSFARFEVKRGLNPALVMIYWATLARISESEEGYEFAPAVAPTITREDWETAIAPVAPAAPASVDDIRSKQAQEKKRIQAELEEIKRRRAEVEELKKRQIDTEAQRKLQVQAEHKRRQQTDEARKLQAGAEELKQLKAEADVLKKQQAESETRLRQDTAELKRQAEAEAKRLREDEAVERQRQIEAEAEEQAQLAAELDEIKRQQADSQEQARIEAEGLEREARSMEDKRLQIAAEDQLRIEAQSEEKSRLKAELEEIKRQQTEVAREGARLEADERKRQIRAMEDTRFQAAAEDQLRTEAQPEEKSRLKGELEQMKQQQAQEREIVRLVAEQRLAEEAARERSLREPKTDRDRQYEANELESARLKAELEAMFRDKEQEQAINGAARLDNFAPKSDDAIDTPDAVPEGPSPIDQLLAEMPKVADVVSRVVADSMKPDVTIPPEFAKDGGLEGETELEGEPALAAHMKKTLRRTRWQKKETDFDGFKSPPGRF